MRKLMAVAFAMVVCVMMVGCGDVKDPFSNIEKPRKGIVDVSADFNGVKFEWVVNGASGNIIKTLYLRTNDMEKLSTFADTLEECSGYYRKAYLTMAGDRGFEIAKCHEILPKSEMTSEYNNGYICKRCKEYRQEELKRKMDSLK